MVSAQTRTTALLRRPAKWFRLLDLGPFQTFSFRFVTKSTVYQRTVVALAVLPRPPQSDTLNTGIRCVYGGWGGRVVAGSAVVFVEGDVNRNGRDGCGMQSQIKERKRAYGGKGTSRQIPTTPNSCKPRLGTNQRYKGMHLFSSKQDTEKARTPAK